MKINRKEAEKLWKERYGNRKFAMDFHGNFMWFDAYGDPNFFRYFRGEKIYCGWNIHHILPKGKGGPNTKGNLECTNIITNQLIEDKTTYWLDDKKYQIKKITFNEYEIRELISDEKHKN